MHVEQLVLGQQRLLDQRAERAHDDGLRAVPAAGVRDRTRASSSLTLLRLREREPELAARARRPAASASRRPRPRGRSGRVSTSAGRCGAARRAAEDAGGERPTCRERRRATLAGGPALGARRRPPSPRASRASPPCAPRARCGRGSARRRGGRSRAGSRAPAGPRPRSRAARRARPARRTRTRAGRSTSTCTAGRLRQPSCAVSSSSLVHSSAGLTSAVSGSSS